MRNGLSTGEKAMSEYQSDAVDISDETTVDELIEYTKNRAKNPIVIDGVKIYDFNTHEPKIDALEKAIEHKLQKKLYKIPLQVTGANTFVISLLPDTIRKADNLIFRKNIEQYYAYKSFHSESSYSQKSEVREEINEIIHGY